MLYSKKSMLVVVALVFCSSATFAADVGSLAKKVRSRGFKYILYHQNEDGSYGKTDDFIVGKTALVVYSLASGERAYRENHGPMVSKAVDFIRKHKNEDGSYGKADPVAETRLVALAFMALGTEPRTADAAAAQKWLAEQTKPDLAVAATLGEKTQQQVLSLPAGAKVADPSFLQQTALLPDTKLYKVESVYALMLATALGISENVSGTQWLEKVVDQLGAKQDLADEMGKDFGKVAGQAGTLEEDPLVATALACIAADRVKSYAKKISK